MKKKLIVIDLSNFIFRAFFAIRPLHAADGTPVNAVYGVLSMLHKMFTQFSPTHILVAMDSKDDSFRKEKYPEYKANRTAPPDELIPQFDLIQELIIKMGLPHYRMPRFEADDIIGTFIKHQKQHFDEILIASGDKDLMQFVDEKVHILDTMKEKILGIDDVFEKMGVKPHQIVDYLALIGDSSDNIPGVPGIGPKGAATLLAEYQTLEKILEHVDAIKNKRMQTALLENKNLAIISQDLAQIYTDLEIPLSVTDLEYSFSVSPDLHQFLDHLGFKKFLEKFSVPQIKKTEIPKPQTIVLSTALTVTSIEELKKYLHENDEVFLSPFWNQDFDFSSLLKSMVIMVNNQVIFMKAPEEDFWLLLKQQKNKIIAWDLKSIVLRMLPMDQELPKGSFDLSQGQFVLNPESKNNFIYAVENFLGVKLSEIDTNADLFFDPTLELKNYVEVLPQLKTVMFSKLQELDLLEPYEKLDLPLITVLAKMERRGIYLDISYFEQLEKEFDQELKIIETKIKTDTNSDVNLKSPKQVGELLFEKLNLPVIRKTKTGFSTDADVLNELKQMNLSPIPEMILRFRELEKLQSTYVRVFPKLVHAQTKKLHTHYKLSNAATGRLSSDHPNLQNIPIRSESGQLLRKGFKADEGCLLLSADYSQVELRLLAHFSQDPVMLHAFEQDLDIHQQTAAEIFQIPLDQVTKVQRNSAKAINFGLMYGQSSFGLSQALGITQNEAKIYITNYFNRFQQVKIYLDSLKDKCEELGYAETLFHRKRFLPDIHSSNRQIKSMAERMAINSPIQGTAADIIKLAMINIDHVMTKDKLKSSMVLQVHDELIFNVFPEELELMKSLVPQKMENAVSLSVRLKVDMGIGGNWFELK